MDTLVVPISGFCQNSNKNSSQLLGSMWQWVYTITTTTHHRNHPTHHHTNSMSAISQLVLIRFWWNFNGRFIGSSKKYSNCHKKILPNFFWDIHSCGPTFFGPIHFWPKYHLGIKKFLTNNFLNKRLFWTKKFWGPKIFLDKNIFLLFFLTHNIF